MEMEVMSIDDVLGYSITDEELKRKISENPKLSKDVKIWLDKYIGKSHMNAIKDCKVEYIDYDDLDIDELDEFERKEITKKIKRNNKQCPNHRTCPLFISNTLPEFDKCPLELMDTQQLLQGLAVELEIGMDEFNDSILVQQLVSLNVIFNRAMRGLASSSLVEDVITYQNGKTKYDTKTNEYLKITGDMMNLMEKLRKSLILNRDDKIKYKRTKQANTIADARKEAIKTISSIEDSIDMNDIVNNVMAESIEDIDA